MVTIFRCSNKIPSAGTGPVCHQLPADDVARLLSHGDQLERLFVSGEKDDTVSGGKRMIKVEDSNRNHEQVEATRNSDGDANVIEKSRECEVFYIDLN